MKISILIKLFADVLPVYKKAVTQRWDNAKLSHNNMELGLCYKIMHDTTIDVNKVIKRHYKHFIKNNYLFPYSFNTSQNIIEVCIESRRDFLKTEIKRLKRLEKEGFTHL